MNDARKRNLLAEWAPGPAPAALPDSSAVGDAGNRPHLSREPAHGRGRAEIALLLSILVVGAVPRLVGIGAQSLWYDEWLTSKSAQVPFTRVIASVRDNENCPPLYFVVVNAWSKAFGTSEAA